MDDNSARGYHAVGILCVSVAADCDASIGASERGEYERCVLGDKRLWSAVG